MTGTRYFTEAVRLSSNPLAFAQPAWRGVKAELSERGKVTLVISLLLLRPQISKMAKSTVSLQPHSMNPHH